MIPRDGEIDLGHRRQWRAGGDGRSISIPTEHWERIFGFGGHKAGKSQAMRDEKARLEAEGHVVTVIETANGNHLEL